LIAEKDLYRRKGKATQNKAINIDFEDVYSWIQTAYQIIANKPTVIINCFSKAGFTAPTVEEEIIFVDELSDVSVNLTNCVETSLYDELQVGNSSNGSETEEAGEIDNFTGGIIDSDPENQDSIRAASPHEFREELTKQCEAMEQEVKEYTQFNETDYIVEQLNAFMPCSFKVWFNQQYK
jgi:hypothetical protein